MSRLKHPIRAIREPFGTAGLVVACLALILALTGAAFAAAGLNGKQKKEVKAIAKQYAGKPGAPGATGPAGPQGAKGDKGDTGAKGEDGSDGTNGTNGTNGTSATTSSFTGEKTVGSVTCEEGGVEVKSASPATAVCNGSPWTAGGTLPPGETETGVWSADFPASGSAVETKVPISFPIPLAEGKEGTSFFFTAEKVMEQEFTNGCQWELENPDARPESTVPGTLCVFEEFGEGGVKKSFLAPGNPLGGGFAAPGSYLRMERSEAATGPTFSVGVWAVRAPE